MVIWWKLMVVMTQGVAQEVRRVRRFQLSVVIVVRGKLQEQGPIEAGAMANRGWVLSKGFYLELQLGESYFHCYFFLVC